MLERQLKSKVTWKNSMSVKRVKWMEICLHLEGTVVKGRKIGRTIGYPTVNLAINSGNEALLKRGVYGVEVFHGDKNYLGVMNVGVRPTFKEDSSSVSHEVHIINFDQNIYGHQLKVNYNVLSSGRKNI